MGFIGIYKAIYDYAPQAEGELQITEGDVLYVLEKSTDDDWWKAKKKATAEDEEEPVGLIPNNYIEEVKPEQKARALYEYTRQTDEELSFPEDAQLDVYDDTDPDWILAGYKGDFGFIPANYIEIEAGGQKQAAAAPAIPAPPPLPARTASDAPSPALPPRPPSEAPSSPSASDVASPAAPNPATMIAGMMAARAGSSTQPPAPLDILPRQPPYTAEESEEEVKSPPLPVRPRGDSRVSEAASPSPAYSSPAPTGQQRRQPDYGSVPQTPNTAPLTPGDFHMYTINEMVSVMGKKKKMPTTLGINLRTGMILVAPEDSDHGPSLEWTADKMTHYSREGKHVFMELVKPSKSADFHAGAKDTAEEIVAMLGELAGAVRAEGLMEIVKAGQGSKPIQQKKGLVLYDFMAQGDDEVTVGIGDEVIVLDDTKSEEWWQVRRVKNQQEGVVPSSYIEITGILDTPVQASTAGINAGRSTIEQNRLEEARLTKEAIKAAKREEQKERSRGSEVGPGLRLPERSSSLSARNGNTETQQHGSSRRENGRAEASGSSKNKDGSAKTKPDPAKVRTWTDRSKSFTVEAQFLGVKDGKLNLHKMNGVRIAVPIAKMSLKDLEYVEQITGISLDEDKPLSDLKKRAAAESARNNGARSNVKVGASIEPKKPSYDWFQFFLSCDVQPGLCERYCQAFERESMDESVLPDVDATVLRNLGMREGDIIKVMRYLDLKYGRTKKGGDDDSTGSLFSGPGGTLRNNTRKGRPAPPVETKDTVDASVFKTDGTVTEPKSASPTTPVPASAASSGKPASGFDDDAWAVKPSKTPQPVAEPAKAPEPAPVAAPTPAPAPASATAPAPRPAPAAVLTGSMQELSLLTQPLTPEKVQTPAPVPPMLNLAPASAPTPAAVPAAAPQIPQPTGATPGFFSGMQPPAVNGQSFAQQLPQNIARQRPLAPQYTQGQGGLMPPPPPSRPLSAPQSAQPSQFAPPPLQPQMTGFQPQIAPPGQSLNEINQARLQQQYAQAMQAQQQQLQPQMQPQMQPMMPMMTGIPVQQTGFQAPGQFIPQQTGIPNGMSMGAPLQMQPTGFAGGFPQPQQQPFTPGLQQPMQPQMTGLPPPMQPQVTGMPGFGNPGGLPAPIQPLVPQQTGPPPPVRFGVSNDAKKLAPQPTGRRANLAAATPDNPFGF
ncbi:hypothetical protein QBC35DRAFT_383679 [Podospora australis]|uniref:Actin cytoskeleton-regulatory complex protein SLA1 n=1 Tax=Podospora australis TaxID=1536484 RepID=A0AAN6WTC7_9PEZI|nr:hypothetical protein QBC35DRAFT_383679 [Podospora australis]